MMPLGILAGSVAAAVDSAATTNLRLYVAGDVSPGLFPPELKGQAEVLKANSPRPEAIVMH